MALRIIEAIAEGVVWIGAGPIGRLPRIGLATNAKNLIGSSPDFQQKFLASGDKGSGSAEDLHSNGV